MTSPNFTTRHFVGLYAVLEWNKYFISYVLDEISLEDRCFSYWNRFLKALSNSTDGNLIFEKANLAEIRKS